MLQFEVFAAAPAEPARLWALVGDLGRLPEWTDADEVAGAPHEPAVGDRFRTVDRGRVLEWTVITSQPRLIEVKADTTCGRLGIGVSVAADPHGSRLVLAGLLDPRSRRWRAHFVELPRLRRRFDDWSTRAVRATAED